MSNSNHTNRLAEEKSPYLLQHQHNPVDWLPWGEAAFAQAREQNKPIFLSIGYSTCHWCHVMERESFEDESIAAYLNEHFVPVKVDREERPDVDRVHMTFVQATNNGQGGWPMSVFLTPELKPFYGGTYFPPRDAYGRPGFGTLLRHLATAWQNDRAEIEKSADEVVAALQSFGTFKATEGDIDWDEILSRSFAAFSGSYDKRWGGFGRAPKFPRPVAHDFLHRVWAATTQRAALEMSAHTLLMMATRGMNDQLGGGFHRYSVDEQWIVSHFEKMLYDQAQLLISLLEAFQLSGDDTFARAAQSTAEYVLRDLTHPEGGFFAAEDADSLASSDADHKIEGAFYVWTQAEIEALLGDDATIFNFAYGVLPKGNAPRSGDPHGEFAGKNILYQAASIDEIAGKFKLSADDVAAKLQSARAILLQARNNRPRPHRDEKIIVAWNGLMISALSRAGAILREPRYLEAARRASAFIRRELWDEENGTLRRHYKDGASEVGGFADDYAALCRGMIDLWEATGDADYLRWAEWLQGTLDRDFWDADGGAYFNSPPDPSILVRAKEDYDGAEPSANSFAAQNLLRLHHAVDRPEYIEKAQTIFQLFAERLRGIPSAMPALEVAAMISLSPPQHIVLVGRHDSDDLRAMLSVAHERFAPFATILVLDETNRAYFEERLPFVRAMTMKNERATAYVCRDFTCRAPVDTVEDLRRELGA